MLKVVLQMMLSRKNAALFALMVFALQGVIGRPAAPDNGGGMGGVGAGRFLGGGLGGLLGGGGLGGLLGGGGSSGGHIGSGGSVGVGGGHFSGAWYVKYSFASDPSLFFFASI